MSILAWQILLGTSPWLLLLLLLTVTLVRRFVTRIARQDHGASKSDSVTSPEPLSAGQSATTAIAPSRSNETRPSATVLNLPYMSWDTHSGSITIPVVCPSCTRTVPVGLDLMVRLSPPLKRHS